MEKFPCSGCDQLVPLDFATEESAEHYWWVKGYRNLGDCKVRVPECPPGYEARTADFWRKPKS